MSRLLAAALAGGLFGAGLLVSGMTDPAKVQGFLDIFGNWDPTLAFVMGGAILPMLAAWRIAARRRISVIDAMPLPERPDPVIDRRLLGGAALFGVGWGLSGLCPGPAMASLGFGGLPVWAFFLAMLVGMAIYGRVKA
ncbi:hypothetical protein MLD63_09125 [Paracoccus sp. TK19116]|uniref:YeeE/YedE family protein n=1 Tax=Paracoccus albicereus TaxID=2922394 RepID=A0ABT1MQL4_9RHOB|nr:DUF6691 family protein [Paracoccus albicereus]MCQ0970583.1 hypothetical protein [Paracoccus albicereus]